MPQSLLGKSLELKALDSSGAFILYDDNGTEILKGHVGTEAAARGVALSVSKLGANPGTRFKIVRSRRLDVLTGLQSDLQIAEQGRESGILRIVYESKDATLAEKFVQRVADA